MSNEEVSNSKVAALALMAAAEAWKKAPVHVKAMAGPYVGPLLNAIAALAVQTDQTAEQFANFVRLHEAGKTEKFNLEELDQ